MILVVGATGFLGRYLCPAMVDQGMDVLALGRSPQVRVFLEERGVRFQEFDIADTESYARLPKHGVECVINLAARLAEIACPVDDMFVVNSLGTYRLLEYCRERAVNRFILASTHKVYNDIDHLPLRTTDHPSFRGDHSPYIISKIAAEHLVDYYSKDFAIRGVILRLTGVHGYGEILGQLGEDGDYQKSAFEIFVERARMGQPLEVWGDCTAVRDHIYIKDAVAAFLAATKSEKARGTYNVATGVGVSLLDEARAIARAFSENGRTSPVVRRPEQTAFTRSYVYDIEATKRDLDWQPVYDLDMMLSDYRRELLKGEYHHYHFIKEGQRPATM